MAIHVALALALAESLALALLLLIWSARVAGANLLVLFLVGVSVWIVGNEMPFWFGIGTERWALGLLATASLTSAVFLHFCVVFCRVPVRRGTLAAGYLIGAAGMALAMVLRPGRFAPFAGLDYVAIPNAIGWVTSMTWAVLAGAGILVLAYRLMHVGTAGFRQVAAVAASCGWGLACMSGYGIAALDLPLYPFPLLGLPVYPVILVYGILRYRVFVANVWARRAVAFAILLALGLAIVALTLWLPFESRWVGGLLVATTCLALNGPVRRLAERLIYPGGTVSASDLSAWRSTLESAESLPVLADRASRLLSQRLGTAVAVTVGAAEGRPDDSPRLHSVRRSGGWTTELSGWEGAPPGLRHAAELFGTALSDAAARVEQAQSLATQERQRQLQARLAELGSLAATVAHDIRNPLNIIAMAVAGAPAETRREVAGQVDRISRLASDLLDYAKPWAVALVRLDLGEQVRQATRQSSRVEIGPGLDSALFVRADARRLEQALTNLLTNAQVAVDQDEADARRAPTSIHIDAEAIGDDVLLHVCDNGPGVPPDMRDRLFEPFASRSPGGTGLGLAIVARIMAAHDGSVALTDRPPWTTTFTLRFPRSP